MQIKTLSLQDFRNYPNQTLELNPGLNIFVGKNAQGKTNLLEAIYVLSLSKSYRASRENELIRHGAQQTILRTQIQKMALLDLTVQISTNQAKRLFINQKVATPNTFIGHLNTVLFTPDSLLLVKGAPGDRRRFLDIQICQIDAVYRNDLLKYQRVVRQRNSLLKDSRDNRSLLKQLPPWDQQLMRLGSKVMLRRQEIVDILQNYSKKAHESISHELEELKLVYRPFFHSSAQSSLEKRYTKEEVENIFGQELEKVKSEEIRRGYTLLGPQRDDLFFLINDLDLKTYGSQGQQRTAVLAYILAELELMYQETGEYPVVLLDDVMSELDQMRRADLLSILNKKAQTIVTTTNIASFSPEVVAEASVFHIENGKII